ncbi:calcium ion binding protein [Reticulomyxa filosa]|uniref:Calmodulin n=1 Tax=Reticulomyxa filosa TaxID=46433 RepID=X6NW94_RETFI|nr:calcium ion binding protein [Reticulomyxa filosa]|eukprot:ETO30580.1 calcium ion binding protein [Reticulomyxa filosa]
MTDSKVASTSEDIEMEQELKQAFSMFDNDNDGEITSVELGKVMEQLGQKLTDQELADMIKEIDADGNGSVDFEEFKSMMAKQLSTHHDVEQELQTAFELVDKDHDGKLSAKDLKEAMKSFGEDISDEEISDMIRFADQDNSSREFVNFESFKKIMLAGDGF